MTEDAEIIEAREIDHAQRVKSFIEDDVVRAAIERVQGRYVEEMKAGETPEAREAAWSKWRAIDGIIAELANVVESGKRATILRTRREASRPTSRPVSR